MPTINDFPTTEDLVIDFSSLLHQEFDETNIGLVVQLVEAPNGQQVIVVSSDSIEFIKEAVIEAAEVVGIFLGSLELVEESPYTSCLYINTINQGEL